MQSLGMERNEYRYLFLWLVQCGMRSICPSFCCKDFFVTFLNCGFMLMTILNSTVQSILCQASNV